MARFIITLLLLLCSAVGCASVLERAKFELKVGENAHDNKEFNLAVTTCKKGLKLLGSPNSYSRNGLRDDTELKLTLAKVGERDGNIEQASSITCRVLKNRIELIEQKISEE